jgi:hypothetical protein
MIVIIIPENFHTQHFWKKCTCTLQVKNVLEAWFKHAIDVSTRKNYRTPVLNHQHRCVTVKQVVRKGYTPLVHWNIVAKECIIVSEVASRLMVLCSMAGREFFLLKTVKTLYLFII